MLVGAEIGRITSSYRSRQTRLTVSVVNLITVSHKRTTNRKLHMGN